MYVCTMFFLPSALNSNSIELKLKEKKIKEGNTNYPSSNSNIVFTHTHICIYVSMYVSVCTSYLFYLVNVIHMYNKLKCAKQTRAVIT